MGTLFFAALAVAVLWKLFSVLGSRTDAEGPPLKSNVARESEAGAPGGNVIRLPGAAGAPPPAPPSPESDRWKEFAEPGSRKWTAFDAMASIEKDFSPQRFLDGARIAYETVVAAYASGDRKGMRALVAKEVADSFEAAIAEREGRGETAQTTFVSIDRATIEDAQALGDNAHISVRFVAKLIHAVRSREGAVVQGSLDKVVEVVEVWTFVRTLGSRDPNWQIMATDSAS